MPDRRHRAAVPDQLLGRSPGASRSWSTAATSTASPTSTTARPAARPAWSITLKRDANANVVLNNLYKLTQLQTQLRRQHGRAGRRRAAHAQPRHRRCRATSRHQVDVITRRSRVPARQGPRSRAHPRGPDQGARRHRPDHRPHPRQREPGGGQGRPDGRAVRVQRGAGRRHPRHAAGASSPGSAASTSRPSSPTCASRIVELEAILADPAVLRRGHQGRADRDQGRVRHAAASARSASTTARCPIVDLVDDKELVVVMTEAQYVKAVDGRRVQDAGPRRPRRQRRQAEDRRPRPPRDLHHGPRVPAVLLQPRPGVPPAGAGHPRARAHGQGHADRQPAAAAGRRDDPGDHRHPRLRRRAQPVLRHPHRAWSRRPRSTSTTTADATG